MFTKNEWEKYEADVQAEIERRKTSPNCVLRLGQWAFNLLFSCKPDVANEITATEVDPFYCDEHLEKFMLHLQLNHVEE